MCVYICIVCTCPCRSGCPDPAWLSQSEESSDCDQYRWTGCYSERREEEKKKNVRNTEMFNVEDRVKDSETSVQWTGDREITLKGEQFLLEQASPSAGTK